MPNDLRAQGKLRIREGAFSDSQGIRVPGVVLRGASGPTVYAPVSRGVPSSGRASSSSAACRSERRLEAAYVLALQVSFALYENVVTARTQFILKRHN